VAWGGRLGTVGTGSYFTRCRACARHAYKRVIKRAVPTVPVTSLPTRQAPASSQCQAGRACQRNKDLGEKLKAEWPAILRWMCDGTEIWLNDGLNPPQAVLDATGPSAEFIAAYGLVRQPFSLRRGA
jgi:hypothetical protein